LNLIRVMPALGTERFVLAGAAQAAKAKKVVGFFTAGPDAIATVEKAAFG